MAEKSSYKTKTDAHSLQLAQKILTELPPYAKDYMNSKYSSASAQTILQYTYSLRTFFVWLSSAVPELQNAPMSHISLDTLSALTPRDFDEFMIYLQTNHGSRNSRASVAQKLSAIGSLFNYLFRNDLIPSDPTTKVERPKTTKDNRIIYLTDEECIRLLDAIEFGSDLVPTHQQHYLEATRCRDLAIATLMLDTGIRLSECVGLNIEDVNLAARKIQIYRKGGKYQYLPLNDEVVEILTAYLTERKAISAADKDAEKALFLSMQKTRLERTAINNMIRKYARLAGINKPITPHKLRKTYGTALYQKTRDIYLTANALGHENIATTSRHYVNDAEDSLRAVANSVSVRKNSASGKITDNE